jgi:hypothetical protein
MESEVRGFEEPPRSGHKLLDMITSTCALVISAISIYMAYDNGRDMQRLVHANSWPVLTLNSSNSGGRSSDGSLQLSLSFGLRNAGIGPARIHSFEFLVDKVPVRGPWPYTLVAACCPDLWKKALADAGGKDYKAVGDEFTWPIAGTFLSPGEGASALGWPRSEANAAIWDAVDEARKQGRIATRACYCSVFDECWVAEPGTFPPRSVSRCK